MTTIAAFKDRHGDIVIGSDSAATAGCLYTIKKSKLIVAGQLVIGICGLATPQYTPSEFHATLEGVYGLAAEYKNLFAELGHGTNEDGVMQFPFGAVIAGPGIGPFLLDGVGTVLEFAEEYVACGSGEDFALGVLAFFRAAEADNAEDIHALDVVVAALSSACVHDPGSRGPLYTIVFKTPEAAPQESLVKPPARKRAKRTTVEANAKPC